MNINISNSPTYINKRVTESCLKKEENKKEFDLKVSNEEHKTVSHKPKKRILRYLLEGDIIKVYAFEDGKKKCIQTIPLAKATPDVLSQVENLSFKDMLKIIEMQRKGKAY